MGASSLILALSALWTGPSWGQDRSGVGPIGPVRVSTLGPLYLTYVWVRASCAVARRDYSSLHACKEEEEERCLFLEREW